MPGIKRGLNVKFRTEKGIGWNRALPAPFGFDKGFAPDGVNDYFQIPRLLGTYLPNTLTVEFWMKTTAVQEKILRIGDTISGINVGSNSNGGIGINGGGYYSATIGLTMPADNTLHQYVYTSSREFGKRSLATGRRDGVGNINSLAAANSPTGYITTIGSDGNYGEPPLITQAMFGRSGSNMTTGVLAYQAGKTDELRVYKDFLSDSDVNLNYNSGVGSNPCNTEKLYLWYKFQQFEMLDFSALQDNSDIRLGLRDYSGNNYHAQPMNMDTNPASGTYALQPF